jgi:bla regulator protein BlaR1
MKTELLRHLLTLTMASTLSILVTLAIRRVVRLVFGAAAAYSAWLLVPATMLAALLPNPDNSDSAIGNSLRIDSISALRQTLGSSLGSSLPVPSLDWTLWALSAWAVGATLFVLYLAGLQRSFVNSLGALSGSRCVLRAERSRGCPALLGVLRPKVILPVDFESRYTRLERLLVLSHERTHLRRGDAIWNALFALMRCLLWFNPLVHLASTRFREDQELSCDAAVVEDHPGSHRTYATAMLKTQLADAALPVGCHWHSMQHLKERLQMLKKSGPSRRRRTCGRVLVALASLVVGFAAWAIEPPATESATASASAPTNETRSPKLTLTLGPCRNSKMSFQADHEESDSDKGVLTMEGHVHIETSARCVRWTPSQQMMTADPRTIVVEGDKAVLTRQANGGSKVEIENGLIRFL